MSCDPQFTMWCDVPGCPYWDQPGGEIGGSASDTRRWATRKGWHRRAGVGDVCPNRDTHDEMGRSSESAPTGGTT